MSSDTKAALKVLSRAPGLDDPNNHMKAYVSTRAGQVNWLVYVGDADFAELENPNYLTMYVETGAHANDF